MTPKYYDVVVSKTIYKTRSFQVLADDKEKAEKEALENGFSDGDLPYHSSEYIEVEYCEEEKSQTQLETNL